MLIPFLLGCTFAGDLAPDSGPVKASSRSVGSASAHLRIGLHASAHDLSPLVGVEWSDAHVGAALDGWIRPFYWKTLEQLSATRWAQYRILYFGFNPSIFAIVGDRSLGLVPMAGLELVTGDISGSSKNPKGEVNPWAGLGVAFADHQRVQVRLAANEGVLGWVRGEWTVVF